MTRRDDRCRDANDLIHERGQADPIQFKTLQQPWSVKPAEAGPVEGD
jgi:hypothetical protein